MHKRTRQAVSDFRPVAIGGVALQSEGTIADFGSIADFYTTGLSPLWALLKKSGVDLQWSGSDPYNESQKSYISVSLLDADSVAAQRTLFPDSVGTLIEAQLAQVLSASTEKALFVVQHFNKSMSIDRGRVAQTVTYILPKELGEQFLGVISSYPEVMEYLTSGVIQGETVAFQENVDLRYKALFSSSELTVSQPAFHLEGNPPEVIALYHLETEAAKLLALSSEERRYNPFQNTNKNGGH